MQATRNSVERSLECHNFKVTHNNVNYDVTIWLNDKGKFIDSRITFSDSTIELDCEGEQGDIGEAIISFLSDNWDNITDADTTKQTD